MKTLYLIVSKIKMIIRESPFIFTVLCIGMVACNLMFIYTYGAIQEFKADTNIADYYIYFNGTGDKLDIEEIDSKVFSVTPKGVIDYYSIVDADTTSVGDVSIEASQFVIRTREDVTFFKTSIGNIKYLAEENTVVIPDVYREMLNSTILLNGVELQAVGTAVGFDFIVSKSNYICSGYTPDMIAVKVLDNGASREALTAALGTAYTVEYQKNQAREEDAMAMQYEMYCVYVLCAMTFLFLCTFIYEDSAYELNVYQILGASRGKIIVILSGTMLILLSAFSLLTQIIHALLYDSVFSKLFTSGGYIYTIKDYALIFAASICVVEAFIVLYISFRTRKSAIRNARRAIR